LPDDVIGQEPGHGAATLPERPASGEEPTEGRHKWFVLSTVSVGTFMATLDGSIVNISLPKIQQAFGVGLSTIEWIVVAYLLTVGTLLLPFGRLGEIFGFKRVYQTGFAVFTLASVLCGASINVWMLVAFRVLQGIGASMMQSMGPAIIGRTFGPRERGRALGLNAISVSIGLTIGPTVGGILTEWGSWRWIFYINLPVGLFAIAWASRVLHNEQGSTAQRFDPLGAALQFGALFSLLLALIEGERWGWSSAVVVSLLVTAVILGVAFVVSQLRNAQPMLDLRLFAIRSFSAGNLSLLIAFAAMFTATFLMPFFLERAQGRSALDAGLLLTPVPLATMVVAPLSGALSDRIGSRLPATLGVAVMALGLFLLTRIGAGTSSVSLIWRLVIIGIGQGLFLSPNSSAVLGSVPRQRLGTASATLAQMRIDGQAFGLARAGAIVAARTITPSRARTGRIAPNLISNEAFVLALHDAFYVAAAICAFAIVASMVRGDTRHRSAPITARSSD
jgi:EmrB/QacA subfamily drug resistance transporter